MPIANGMCCGCAVLCDPLPRGWTASQQQVGQGQTTQLPQILLPLADPESFLDQHEEILGINARNVLNIAPPVCSCPNFLKCAHVLHMLNHM